MIFSHYGSTNFAIFFSATNWWILQYFKGIYWRISRFLFQTISWWHDFFPTTEWLVSQFFPLYLLVNFKIFSSKWLVKLARFLHAICGQISHFPLAVDCRILRFSCDWLKNFVLFQTSNWQILQYFFTSDWWISGILLTTYWWNLQVFLLAIDKLISWFFSCNRLKNSQFLPVIDWQISQFFSPDWLTNFVMFSDDRMMDFTIYFQRSMDIFRDSFLARPE